MPFLSIIIPCFKVQAYLQECMESVLGQSFRDFEVIGVNDASPDHSGEILDSYARKDPRVKVVHLAQNGGLGPARNAGLEHAQGEYIMFLDSDDTLAPVALDRIADKLDESGSPDMLLLDHARTYWWGKVQRNIRSDILEGLSSAPFVAEGHPEIFALLQVAWNKVCRRDFLEREALHFPAGYYEDTLWTHKGVLTARSIAALPHVCVYYRQRRHGSILGSSSKRHFEAFEQWQYVFDFLDTRPDLDHWRPLISERMASHYLTILRKSHRISARDKPEFFKLASEQVARYGSAVPQTLTNRQDQILYGLLRSGNYQRFKLARDLNKFRSKSQSTAKRTAKRSRRLRSKLRTGVKLAEYRKALDGPLDPNLAVFSSLWNRGVIGNPGAIYEACTRFAPQIKPVWVIRKQDREDVPEGVDYVIPGTRRYWQTMAKATYFINDVNFPDDVVKRPGQIHIQTQHGTPLKHMGLDLMQHPAAAKGMSFDKLLRRSDRWDYNLSSNTFSTLVWERAFPCEFTTVEAGYPRNDRLVNATAEDVVRARQSLGLPAGKTAILFAPTHRDYDKHFILRADVGQLAQDLGDDFVVLVRAHYFYKWMPELAALEERGLLMNVSAHQDVEELMLASDLLVTDYSSIMFDYANLARPIVIYAPDWDAYRDVRGVYFDLPAEAPGPVATTQADLTKVISNREHDEDYSYERLRRFRESYCEFDDGQASERVVRHILLGEPIMPIIPLSERTPAPAPKNIDLTGVVAVPQPERSHEDDSLPPAAPEGEQAEDDRVEREVHE